MAVFPPRFALTTLSSEPAAPVPIGAAVSAASKLVTVTFDQTLVPGTSAVINWFARADLGMGARTLSPSAPPVIAGSTVSWVGVDTPTIPGPAIVSYVGIPPDVVGLVGGVPAAPFAGFLLFVAP